MKKEEIIAKYGEAAWQQHLAQARAYKKEHKEEEKVRQKKYHEEHLAEIKVNSKRYREEHPEVVIANHQEANRRGGKRYDKKIEYQTTGIPGAKERIRNKHGKQYYPYKAIIAPESQIHHEWVPKTAECRGVALVEKEPHQYGIVDVIEILDGRITLLTEEEIRKGKKKNE